MPKHIRDRLSCPSCGGVRFTLPSAPSSDEGAVVCDSCGEVLGDWRVLKQPRAVVPADGKPGR